MCPSAQAEAGAHTTLAYGQASQTRRDVASSGHLLALGLQAAGEDAYLGLGLNVLIDGEHSDLTQLALFFQGGWAVELGDAAFGWLALGFRTGVDGYPESSFSPFDPGIMLGAGWFGDGLALGVEARGWTGWNLYESHSAVEPYADWRVFVGFGGGG